VRWQHRSAQPWTRYSGGERDRSDFSDHYQIEQDRTRSGLAVRSGFFISCSDGPGGYSNARRPKKGPIRRPERLADSWLHFVAALAPFRLPIQMATAFGAADLFETSCAVSPRTQTHKNSFQVKKNGQNDLPFRIPVGSPRQAT